MKVYSACHLAAICLVTPIFASPPSEDTQPPSAIIECGSTFSPTFSTPNYYKCSDTTDGIHKEDALQFIPYDAYYNGTLTLDYAPTNASDSCRAFVGNRTANLAIGQLAHPVNSSLTRSRWDNNPFFLALEPVADDDALGCGFGSNDCPASLTVLSSQTELYWSQAWTRLATKNGDSYDISGNLTTTKSSILNEASFSIPVYPRLECGRSYTSDALRLHDQVSMTGKITADSAVLVFTLRNFTKLDRDDGAEGLLTYRFSGAAWKDGARLLTTGDKPSTQGTSIFTLAQQKAAKEEGQKAIRSYLLMAIAPAVILIAVAVLLVGCFCCGWKQKWLDRNYKSALRQQERMFEIQNNMSPAEYPERQKFMEQQQAQMQTLYQQQYAQFPGHSAAPSTGISGSQVRMG